MTQQNPTAGELKCAEIAMHRFGHDLAGGLVRDQYGCIDKNKWDNLTLDLAKAFHSALETERRELVEALKPFATLDIAHCERKPDEYPVFGLNETKFTLGDVRKARALLAKYEHTNP